MNVTVLGTHNLETRYTKHTCFLVDEEMAVDAGSLVTSLDKQQLDSLRAILLTHHHFDHVRDIPTLGLLRRETFGSIAVHALAETLEALTAHLGNGVIYPDLTRTLDWTEPRYAFAPLSLGLWTEALGYGLCPIPVPHGPPSIGYLIRAQDGDCIGFTGDTGGNLRAFFEQEATPRVLFVDLTFPDRLLESAKSSGHLTPGLLRQELVSLDEGALTTTTIVAVHRSALHDGEIRKELEIIEEETGFPVAVAEEGMVF